MMMMMMTMNNRTKVNFFGVSVFIVRGGTKTCPSASYLILRSSTQARGSKSF